ncbi:MAG: hypothetical protein Q8M80_07620 [Hydrogenophaga sp.]|jgi:hypothetical protein|uniref:hypothetical protein n=1 Tax=Hydrogenophaga sp. TaxID=1904254 RepID=UPI0025BB155B|nr:hypothetical protein [Hydrogenophaga sp.]MDP2252528.1 hypothetical protein [Hydrogenophaga sp.]MDP2985899.1 hypothetical protein [Hydrogenophaga sp.]MDP3203922.1 hypothetical protein [Hydrogenophaga sp.]MDP3625738.1 hypothetical protein [Hydrogenophaga sp.]
MTGSQRLVIAALGMLAFGSSLANPFRLDDSLSYTVPPNVQMQWLPFARGQMNAGGMEAWVTVNIRIDTRDWIGRTGRIYMVLPRDEASSIEAVWTTQGRLQGGRLVSGERALVYAGTIPGATLEDQIQVRLRSKADWTSNSRRLNFHFELDTN